MTDEAKVAELLAESERLTPVVTPVNARQDRAAVWLELAKEVGGVSEACRLLNVSRARWYQVMLYQPDDGENENHDQDHD